MHRYMSLLLLIGAVACGGPAPASAPAADDLARRVTALADAYVK